MISAIRRALIRRRLNRLMKPDPAYRERRLAQFSAERKRRYLSNVQEFQK